MTYDSTNFSVSYFLEYFARNNGQIIVTAHNSASYVLVSFPLQYADLGQVKYNFDSTGKAHVLLGDVFRLAVSNGWTSGSIFTIGFQTDLDEAAIPFTGIKLYNGTIPQRPLDSYVYPPRKLWYYGDTALPFLFGFSSTDSSRFGAIAVQKLTATGWTDIATAVSAVDSLYCSASLKFAPASGTTYRAVKRVAVGDDSGDVEFWRGTTDDTIRSCEPSVFVEWTGDDGFLKSWVFRETEVKRDVTSTTDIANDRSDNYFSGSFFKTEKDFSLSVTAEVYDLTDEEAVYFDDLATASDVRVVATDDNVVALLLGYAREQPYGRCTAKSITRKIDGKRKDLSFTFDLLKTFAL